MAQFVEQLLQTSSQWDEWLDALDLAEPGISSTSKHGRGTLAIQAASKIDTRAACTEVAKSQWRDGAQVVVLEHTHLPQTIAEDTHRYYNPGSWTRYIEAADIESLTLEELQRETQFPFQLNCVRVEDKGTEILTSELREIDARPAG